MSVQPILRAGERTISLEAELKIDGMPLMRIDLGEHEARRAADSAFASFLQLLQA